MKLYDENSNFIGESKEVYDDSGELLGHFIKKTKETVCDAWESSFLLGLICLILAPGWTILALSVWGIFKLISVIIKFVLRVVWWLIRLPFYLIFEREVPEF